MRETSANNSPLARNTVTGSDHGTCARRLSRTSGQRGRTCAFEATMPPQKPSKGGPNGKAPIAPVTVGSFSLDGQKTATWGARYPAIATILRSSGLDAYLLQEVNAAQMEELGRTLRNNYEVVHYAHPTSAGGVAVLLRKERLELVHQSRLPFWAKSALPDCFMCAAIAFARDRLSGARLVIASTVHACAHPTRIRDPPPHHHHPTPAPTPPPACPPPPPPLPGLTRSDAACHLAQHHDARNCAPERELLAHLKRARTGKDAALLAACPDFAQGWANPNPNTNTLTLTLTLTLAPTPSPTPPPTRILTLTLTLTLTKWTWLSGAGRTRERRPTWAAHCRAAT